MIPCMYLNGVNLKSVFRTNREFQLLAGLTIWSNNDR
ncbi:MAG: hypothetical protein JWM52_304 [Candidatus Saccharibacteria bacterium]|nr:hypothetical protein [Candidatus Saccharibacteria bacterium]